MDMLSGRLCNNITEFGGLKMVVTEIEKGNKLIIPKWLVHQTLGENVKFVWIEKTKEGIEVSKAE